MLCEYRGFARVTSIHLGMLFLSLLLPMKLRASGGYITGETSNAPRAQWSAPMPVTPINLDAPAAPGCAPPPAPLVPLLRTPVAGVWGEFLYLQPRNAEVSYALPIDGPVAPIPGVEIGPTGVVDADYSTGYRAGFFIRWAEESSIGASYTSYDSSADDSLEVAPPDLIRSLVIHPSTVNAAGDYLFARASQDINFQLIDVEFRHFLYCDERTSTSYVIGGRYGQLEQDFHSEFTDGLTTNVDTNVKFDGAGFRLGLEGEQYSCKGIVFIYARGFASLLAGDFRANYQQTATIGQGVVSRWEAGRVVPIVDLEAGLGLSFLDNRLRINAGYLVSAWFNVVKTDDFIQAVQTNNFAGDMGNTLTFDGLVARAEVRF